MGYLFGATVTDNIACGTTVSRATTASSAAVRFKVTSANTSIRRLIRFVDAGNTSINYNLGFSSGATNQANFAFVRDAGGTASLSWTSGFTAGTIHTLVTTYDGATMSLYADTDASAKATVAETGVPFSTGTLSFGIGNAPGAISNTSADSTIYEVAWWPTTLLTGAQAAAFGAGFDATMLGATWPTNHWRLIGNPNDHIGLKHGTVTGATLAAHAVKLYLPGSAAPFVGAVSTFTVGTGIRRTLSELGTRMGSRQVQEA